MVIPFCPNCEKALLDLRAGHICDCHASFDQHIHFKAECLVCGSLYDVLYYESNEVMEIIEF